MAVHSRDRDIKELGAIGGNKPMSRQRRSSSRSSLIAIIQNLVKTLTEQNKEQQNLMQQQQQKRELIQSITDQSNITNSTLADMSRSQTDLSARLERKERACPDLNPVELRTNPSDGNFVFHAVPTQVTAPLIATRPSITSDIDKETETSFRPLTSVSRSLLELNPPPVLRRSERIR